MDALPWLTEPLQHAFMQRALLVSMLVASVCGLLSCYMTLKGWALMGDAVSHAVMPGVVVAYSLGLPFSLGAFVFGVGSVALIGFVKQKSRIKEDTVIGLVFTGFFALGLVLVSKVRSNIDLTHIGAGGGSALGAAAGSAAFLFRSHPCPLDRHQHRPFALHPALGALTGGRGGVADRRGDPCGGDAGHPGSYGLPTHR